MAIVESRQEVVDRSVAIIEKRAEANLAYPINEFEGLVTALVLDSPDKEIRDGMWCVTLTEGTKTIRLEVPKETGELVYLPSLSDKDSTEHKKETGSSVTPASKGQLLIFPIDMIDDPLPNREKSISVTVTDSDIGKIVYRDLENIYPIRDDISLHNSTVVLPTYTFILGSKGALLYREEITKQTSNLPQISDENVSRLWLNVDSANSLTVQEQALLRYKNLMKILTSHRESTDNGTVTLNNVRTLRRDR